GCGAPHLARPGRAGRRRRSPCAPDPPRVRTPRRASWHGACTGGPSMDAGTETWWRRVGTPEEGFRYLKADGSPLRSEHALRRIASLAVPPAWTRVRIAPDPC